MWNGRICTKYINGIKDGSIKCYSFHIYHNDRITTPEYFISMTKEILNKYYKNNIPYHHYCCNSKGIMFS